MAHVEPHVNFDIDIKNLRTHTRFYSYLITRSIISFNKVFFLGLGIPCFIKCTGSLSFAMEEDEE